MSINYIDAKKIESHPPLEREDCRITIYLGIFFDGIVSNRHFARILSSFYQPPISDETEKKYIICSSCEQYKKNNSIDPEDEIYEDILTDQVSDVISRLGLLLCGFVKDASRVKILIDIFAIDDGSIPAALVCDAIEPGRITEYNNLYEKARCSIIGGGIIEDFRINGSDVELNSFTHFDSSTLKSTTDQKRNFLSEQNELSNEGDEINEEGGNLSASSNSDMVLQGYVSKTEFETDQLYISAYKRNLFQELYGKYFIWRYTTNIKIRNTVDEWERALTIISIATLETGIGEILEGVCILLNGISTRISLDLAIMTWRNPVDRNDNLNRAFQSAKGLIPWGKIIGKTVSKSFDFILKKIKKKPKLRVINGGFTPPTSPSPTSAHKDNLIPFPKASKSNNVVPLKKHSDEIILHEVNGGFITISNNSKSNLTVYSYDGGMSGVNNIGSFFRGYTRSLSGSSGHERVEPISEIGDSFNFIKDTPDQARMYSIEEKRLYEEAVLIGEKIKRGKATFLEILRFKLIMKELRFGQ